MNIDRLFFGLFSTWLALNSAFSMAQIQGEFQDESEKIAASDDSDENLGEELGEEERQYWDNVEIYLVTLSRNEVFYTGGGHSLLRVNDKNIGSDRVFNWGTFDFNDPGFIFKFYRGTLAYFMDELSTSKYFAFTEQYFMREYLQDKLVLTAQQKIRVMEKITYWRKPENNKYIYQFYKDNCSTKVRDILDYALGGNIKDHFDSMMGAETPRGFWRQTFAYWPAAIFFTDLLFNAEVDKPLTKWDEMFVPIMLHNHIKDFFTVSDAGEIQENNSLVSESKILIEYSPPQVSPLNGHQWFAVIWGGFLLMSLALFATGKRKIGLRLLGLVAICWGTVATVYGVAIPLTSVLSDRIYWHWSVNLLFLWPVDFLFAWAGIYWIKGTLIPKRKKFLNKWLPRSIKMHAVGIIVFVLDYLMGVSLTNSYLTLVYVITFFAIFLAYSHFATKYATQN